MRKVYNTQKDMASGFEKFVNPFLKLYLIIS